MVVCGTAGEIDAAAGLGPVTALELALVGSGMWLGLADAAGLEELETLPKYSSLQNVFKNV